jgi:hypothetical protein
VETTFIPGKIDRCPEYDSEKIVFPESRDKEEEERIPGKQLALFGLWLRGLPERLRAGRDERRKQSGSV